MKGINTAVKQGGLYSLILVLRVDKDVQNHLMHFIDEEFEVQKSR